ncbi:MAG: hypothetical protein ACM31F_07360 [Gemmatimonas sp.]
MTRTTLIAALILLGSAAACGDLTGPDIHTFRVSGTVRNGLTSQPMAAVKVVAYQPATDAYFFVIPSKTYTSAVTDANGRYSLAFGVKLCQGYFVVSAEAPSSDAVRVEMDGCEAKEKEVVVNLLARK